MTGEPPYVLTLLGDVRWHGTAVVGERSRALLAVLARHPRDGASETRLVEKIWGDEPPANPAKALQVVVSRARAATCREAIVRTPRGYRLGLGPDQVDVLVLGSLVEEARAKLEAGEIGAARSAAQAALEVGSPDGDSAPGALGALRDAASEGHRQANRLLGMALSTGGDHAAALGALRAAACHDPDDEALLACLLRSEAAVRGTGAALGRYERYRARLAEATGADPGPELRRMHGELLAADHPVREGVRFEATELLGREHDIRALHARLRGSRIVSIVGPGGLGKTRLAHVIGRGAEVPVVRVVELVGVTAPEDVVGELGSALGVRDSVTSRRSLSTEQRADVRSRIAAALDRVPTLLILDNCEHLIDAVAELVVFLVGSTRGLRVLATSRAPLNVAGERVYALEALGTADAAELFRQRALAARPAATLPEPAVAEIVDRLDGLPLAIELAAAKVRVISVEDVAARLENRFALLRGGDRAAPDRHQTLLAVIDWSWNLLAEHERAALRWLSVFHDGFSLPAAESVLGPGALDAVGSLADQSLLAVGDTATGARYGMLETVREFGRMQLVDAGEDAAAQAAQSRWARDYAARVEADLHGPGQIAAMDLLRTEETNLADVLRRALGEPDPETVVVLLAALARYWTIRGEHERLFVLADAFAGAVEGWSPPAEFADETRLTLAAMANILLMMTRQASGPVWALLRDLGTGSGRGEVAAVVSVTLALDPACRDGRERIRRLCADPDRLVALHALRVRSHETENAGDPAAAVSDIEHARALTEPADGPWLAATLDIQLAQLLAQLGHPGSAADHAAQALPVLERLDTFDDTIQAHSLIACAALARGRLAEASSQLGVVRSLVAKRSDAGDIVIVESMIVTPLEADLLLARGDRDEGLRHYRDAIEQVRAVRVPGLVEPTDREPWRLYVESAALAAYALYGSGDEGRALFRTLSGKIGRALDPSRDRIDFPVTGLVFYAFAAWGLRRDGLPVRDAVRLAVLAERFGYNRMLPSMAWCHVGQAAERAAPGLLAEIAAEYGERRGEALLDEARALAGKLAA